MQAKKNANREITQLNSLRIYWTMRFGISFIWLWTAFVSWIIYPEAESLDWLRTLGLTQQTYLFFISACLVDAAMGIASLVFSSRRLWEIQFLIVIFYSLAIAIKLPAFLFHPFGPITKNIAVLACLAYLVAMEKR